MKNYLVFGKSKYHNLGGVFVYSFRPVEVVGRIVGIGLSFSKYKIRFCIKYIFVGLLMNENF